jgi:hypothetical protein
MASATAEDFPIMRSVPQPKRLKDNAATPKKRAKKKTYADLSPVVQTAMQDLGIAPIIRHPMAFGWRASRFAAHLIAAANQARVGIGFGAAALPAGQPAEPRWTAARIS